MPTFSDLKVNDAQKKKAGCRPFCHAVNVYHAVADWKMNDPMRPAMESLKTDQSDPANFVH